MGVTLRFALATSTLLGIADWCTPSANCPLSDPLSLNLVTALARRLNHDEDTRGH